MSVTFFAPSATVLGFDVTCAGGHSFINEFGGGAMPYDVALAHLITLREDGRVSSDCDEDCAHYGFYTTPVEDGGPSPELNMSNSNALRVMSVLGIDTESDDCWAGTLDAKDFMGRVLVALAINPVSAEIPTFESQSEGHARMVHCGVPAGYVQERLETLRELADFAIESGRSISWS